MTDPKEAATAPAGPTGYECIAGYLRTLDAAWTAAQTPDEVKAAMTAAYPGYDGGFLLSLVDAYWDKYGS